VRRVSVLTLPTNHGLLAELPRSDSPEGLTLQLSMLRRSFNFGQGGALHLGCNAASNRLQFNFKVSGDMTYEVSLRRLLRFNRPGTICGVRTHQRDEGRRSRNVEYPRFASLRMNWPYLDLEIPRACAAQVLNEGIPGALDGVAVTGPPRWVRFCK